MFEKIPLSHYEPHKRLTSKQLTDKELNDKKYGDGNLPNASFSLMGSVESFQIPPITDYALEHLFHLQAFTLFHYQAPSYTERQNYPSFLIAFTYSGTGSLTYHGKTYSLSKGDGFFIDCMDYHLYKVDKGTWDVAILHVQGPLCKELYAQFAKNGSFVFHESPEGKFQQYLEKVLSIYSSAQLYRDWQASSCIDVLLTYLLIPTRIHTEETEIPQNIRFLIKYMENNYQSHMSLDYLAEFACINKYYLSREFKKYTGFSPNDYLISLRINAAKNLLLNTALPASKIAHEVGIHDINNFTTLFKKKVGMTPIQFRNSSTLFS